MKQGEPIPTSLLLTPTYYPYTLWLPENGATNAHATGPFKTKFSSTGEANELT